MLKSRIIEAVAVTDAPARDVVEECLDNGLRVLVAEDPAVPAAGVNLCYAVGSRHELPGQTGLAHLFEHLMFQGSENVATAEHMAVLESYGASLNASTWFDWTTYYETMPTRALELALWLEADRMGSLPAALDQRNLDSQRGVVQNERRQRHDNQPYGDAFERMSALLFPPGHGYHHLPIGSMADLEAASLDDVRAFFERHYWPGNAVLAIAGDVRPGAAFDLAATYFGAVAAGPAATGQVPAEVPVLGPLARQVRDEASGQVPAEALYCAWRLPPDGTQDYDAAAIALRMLGGGASGRLQELLSRRRRLAQSVIAGPDQLTAGSAVAIVVVQAAQDAALADIEAVLDAELEGFAQSGPDDAELDRALAQAERDWLRRTATLEGLAFELSRAACLFGTADRVNGTVARLRSVTAERVRSVARAWLLPQQRVQLSYHKEQS
jgi:zinc protease